jgi:[protein-PII] uridylyltransferase
MSSAPGLRPLILDVKRRLVEGRERIKARHDKGAPGIQTCRAMTELYDGLILELYRAALVDLKEDGPQGLESVCAVVALGGTGRGDLAPYSDVDLMLLHAPTQAAEDRTSKLAERLLRDVFDVGFQLGLSVRTASQACQAARGDATICTSLIEARLLVGNVELFEYFQRRFRKEFMRRAAALVRLIEQARGDERNQYGETVYLLEPNLKRSSGGLRDIQFVRWIGFLQHGVAEPDGLKLVGALERDDHEALVQAWEFLLHLRNEMHFHAGKGNDLLDKAEQLRLAEVMGYEGSAGLLPVERFMQHYFKLTSRVSGIAKRFAEAARPRAMIGRILSPLVSHRFEGDFRVGPTSIGLLPRSFAKLQSSLEEILRLCDLSNLYDKPIDRETQEAIRAAVPKLPEGVSPQAAKRFLSMLNSPARLGELLRLLHDTGALERVLPDFAHARCLLQFNEYHKFTVDEHTLRAVEQATSLISDQGALGVAYRGLKRKWLLHLALLLHDLGKGYVEDHSDVGLRIATEMAPRLGLDEADAETLKFLVHKHLVMSHLAFRRDTSDEQLITKFAVDVGSAETLQMLYVLTCCDTAAVGPGTLNAWKAEVLTDLYRRTRRRLTSEDPDQASRAALAERRKLVRAALAGASGQAKAAAADLPLDPWYQRHLDELPASYLYGNRPEQVAADLGKLKGLGRQDVVAEGRYSPETSATEYWIGTYEDIAPGVFHRLTGAISAEGLQILSAEINTLSGGLIVDRFWVSDPDYSGEPAPSRVDDVCRALTKALDHRQSKRPAFRKTWGGKSQRRAAAVPMLPTRVNADNATSDAYTVLDIFAADRRGLLYAITRTLYELELNVAVAKIGTYVDQVVDVFYVTDRKGKKITSTAKVNEIRTRLLVAIEAWERSDVSR